MPPWYLKNPETVQEWRFGLTTVDWRKDDLRKRLERSRKLAAGEEPIDLATSGEEGHLLIKAILGLGDLVSNVNIPNRGQIPNLPLHAVVETNALFRRDSIAPVFAGAIPGNVMALIQPHVVNQENTLIAAMTCDYELALTTFLNDPLVTLAPVEGEMLFRTMLERTKLFLPAGWRL